MPLPPRARQVGLLQMVTMPFPQGLLPTALLLRTLLHMAQRQVGESNLRTRKVYDNAGLSVTGFLQLLL